MNDIATAPALEIARKTLPYWQSEPCPVWCNCRHDAGDVGSERDHLSTWCVATRLSLVDADVHVLGDETVVEPRELEVSLHQAYREIGPRVVLAEQSSDGYDLTPDEARELAAALITAAGIAEGRAVPAVTR